MYRKNLMPLNAAHNSLSKALYFVWAALSFLEKKPRGSQAAVLDCRCCKAAPTCVEEASTIRPNSAEGEG
jgi:hypothetical protein